MLIYLARTLGLFSVCALTCHGSYDIGISGGLGRKFDGIGGLSGGGIFGICMLKLATAGYAHYKIDISGGIGRRFDGIGGLDAGATSKLLVNYPEAQRNEILDYLFKPNFGASLHILKVEIGGDGQSTDGTESSHMHEPWDENYQRGYEWWLMTEAKKRNPDIKLYGLAWAFPGWLGNGTGNPYKFPNVTANYVLKWILAAKKFYQLDIDYIGIWNERDYDRTYVETLKNVLQQNSLTAGIQLVVGDGDWSPGDDVLKYPSFAASVDVIGCHYPGTTATNSSIQSGKPLWASEDYSTYNDNSGAGCWARILNQNYVNGYMTSTISWNLIASYYDALPFARDGLMTAIEPWSGHYIVENPIWITAHTTQFAQIGWNYLLHGSGVGLLDHGGSFVTLISPDKNNITIVIETMSHDHSVCIRPGLPPYTVLPQQADFQLTGSLAQIKELFVWKTHLGFKGQPTTIFQEQTSIKPFNGIFTIILYPDELYTLTNVPTGQHGSYASPPDSKPFPLPYVDNFEGYTEFTEAFNYAPQSGVWEVRQTNDPTHGKVNRQVILNDPIYWCATGPATINVGGDYSWTNVQVHSDVLIPSLNGTAGAFIAVRVDRGGCDAAAATGLFFTVFPQNGTFQVTSDLARHHLIANGTCSVKYDTWYRLGLVVKDDKLYGFLGPDMLFAQSLPTTARKSGFTAYGTVTYGYADFDNWIVESTALHHDRL